MIWFLLFYNRYDLGGGQAIMRSHNQIDPGRTHRVIARRHRRKGELIVDGENTVSGMSPAHLTSLDLNDPLYVGFLPEASNE